MSERQTKPRKKHRSGGGKAFPALLCNILGTFLILCVIAMMLPTYIPRLGGYEIYNVVSGSMEPSIPVGSMIFVKDVDAGEIQTGDVIAFYSGGSVVSHRVVDNLSLSREFVTKGDANKGEDMSRVPYDALIGRVENHVAKLGDVMAHATTPLGKIYLFGIIVCGVLFNVIAGRLREY